MFHVPVIWSDIVKGVNNKKSNIVPVYLPIRRGEWCDVLGGLWLVESGS